MTKLSIHRQIAVGILAETQKQCHNMDSAVEEPCLWVFDFTDLIRKFTHVLIIRSSTKQACLNSPNPFKYRSSGYHGIVDGLSQTCYYFSIEQFRYQGIDTEPDKFIPLIHFRRISDPSLYAGILSFEGYIGSNRHPSMKITLHCVVPEPPRKVGDELPILSEEQDAFPSHIGSGEAAPSKQGDPPRPPRPPTRGYVWPQ